MAMLSKAELEGWPSGQRRCWGCKQLKDVEDFGTLKHCKRGRNSRCRECRKVKSKADYEKETQEYRIWYRAKRRARVEGIPFDIGIEDILIPSACPVFGKPFMLGDTDWTPSIDKLIPSKGYVRGNVFIISNKANRMKSNGTLEELQQVLTYVQDRL